MWIEETVLTQLSGASPGGRGRPRIYSDAAIQMPPGLKQVFHLPLRAVQGFAPSLRRLAYPGLPVRNYTILARRAQTLKLVMPTQRPHAPLHQVIDSTVRKVCGEGEWEVRKHGYSKRRTWRKVHLAMDANTGPICAEPMTHQDEGDGEVLPDLLDQIQADVVIDTIGGDGIYDPRRCHGQIAARGASPSIPPRERARPLPDSTGGATWRDAAIDAIGSGNGREWKRATGYRRRSLAETLTYRLKMLARSPSVSPELESTEIMLSLHPNNATRPIRSNNLDQSACFYSINRGAGF